jgi:hypothetical protein
MNAALPPSTTVADKELSLATTPMSHKLGVTVHKLLIEKLGK